eukprot:506288-Amorphochlora_amoeboformis.AAC.1
MYTSSTRLEKKLKLSQEQMNEVKSAAEMFATQAGTLKKEVKTLKETVSSLGDKVEEKEMLSQQLGEQIQLEHKRHETQVAAFEEQIESLNKQHTVRVAEAKQAYEAKLQAVSTELAEIQLLSSNFVSLPLDMLSRFTNTRVHAYTACMQDPTNTKTYKNHLHASPPSPSLILILILNLVQANRENDEEAKKQVQLLRAESSMLKEQNME